MQRTRERKRGRGRRLTLALLLVFALAALGAAGCGDDDDGSGGGSNTTTNVEQPKASGGYKYAGTPAQTEEARKAGDEAAGPKVDPPKGKSIGVIQLSAQSATSVAITDAAKRIGAMFGYKVNVCDPNFDPQKVPQCATSIVSQNPSVIFSVSQNPGPMGAAVGQAGQKGILWFGTGSGTEPPNPVLNDYGIDGIELTKVSDKFMFEKIQERNPDGDKKVFAITAPTVGLASRNAGNQVKKDVEAQPGFSLIDHNLDLANAVQDTLNSSRQTLEQNPNLSAMWTLCDFCVPLMAQTVQAKQPGDQRKTVVVGQFSSPDSIEGVRKGTVDGIADYPWALPVWVGMDQALQKWARNKEPVRGFKVFDTYPLPFMRPYMITKENALASGPSPIYGPDYETFFKTKWAKEFGINPQ